MTYNLVNVNIITMSSISKIFLLPSSKPLSSSASTLLFLNIRRQNTALFANRDEYKKDDWNDYYCEDNGALTI